MAILIVGGGCFWCTEAVFRRVIGVRSVGPGCAGGARPNPTYEQVCAGVTGHAEVVKIDYNTDEISRDELLDIFFATHDATTLNRQGGDVGTQYRSVIFYESEEEKRDAEEKIKEISESKLFASPIVTTIEKLEKFYPAEAYHHDYFTKNPTQGYCTAVIRPKVEKFEKKFKDVLK